MGISIATGIVATPGSSTTTASTGSTASGTQFLVDIEYQDEMPFVPGTAGATGATGSPGATGPAGNGPPGQDGIDGEDAFPIPGPQGTSGAAGANGTNGAQGQIIPPDEPIEPDLILIPGPAGAAGQNGSAGSQGAAGPMGPMGFEGEVGEEAMIIPGPRGATGASGVGGGFTVTEVETNMGSTAVWRGKFTITDAGISGTSKVLVWQAPGPYTGKGTRSDEAEMDWIQCHAVPGSGSAVVHWRSVEGYSSENGQTLAYYQAKVIGRVRGNIKFHYTIGA